MLKNALDREKISIFQIALGFQRKVYETNGVNTSSVTFWHLLVFQRLTLYFLGDVPKLKVPGRAIVATIMAPTRNVKSITY